MQLVLALLCWLETFPEESSRSYLSLFVRIFDKVLLGILCSCAFLLLFLVGFDSTSWIMSTFSFKVSVRIFFFFFPVSFSIFDGFWNPVNTRTHEYIIDDITWSHTHTYIQTHAHTHAQSCTSSNITSWGFHLISVVTKIAQNISFPKSHHHSTRNLKIVDRHVLTKWLWLCLVWANT